MLQHTYGRRQTHNGNNSRKQCSAMDRHAKFCGPPLSRHSCDGFSAHDHSISPKLERRPAPYALMLSFSFSTCRKKYNGTGRSPFEQLSRTRKLPACRRATTTTDPELHCEPVARSKPLDILVTCGKGRQSNLVREFGKRRVREHGHVPDQFVADVGFRRVERVSAVANILSTTKTRTINTHKMPRVNLGRLQDLGGIAAGHKPASRRTRERPVRSRNHEH